MALPYRTTGSLCPAFASARLVSLAVKHAYAIALSSRCPTVTSVPSNSSVTLWEETAQSNCLPCTVPNPDYGPRLEPQTHQGGISTLAPQDLATLLQSLPPILHRSVQSPIQSYGKGSWGLSVFPRGDCIITNISTSLSLRRRQCAIATPFVQVGTYPTRNFATLGPLLLRPPFTGSSIKSLHPII